MCSTPVPLLVGAYDSGVGIAKLGRDSVSAAIMDSTGRVIADERLFMLNSTTDAIDAGADMSTPACQEEPTHGQRAEHVVYHLSRVERAQRRAMLESH